MDQDGIWHGGSLIPGDFVLDGDPAPLPKKGADPQTAAWIKMPLGTEVGLGPDDTVIDGNPAPPPQKGRSPLPQFLAHVYCGQTAGLI